MLNHNIRELSGRVLGIVGYGTLGRAVAQGAQAALDMRVMIAGRPGQGRGAGTRGSGCAAAGSDVLSLHCPLTPAPANMIGRARTVTHEARCPAGEYRRAAG